MKQKELERLYQHEIKGIKYSKSKVTWMEYGEKCTKHFLQLQNRNISRKNIVKLLNEYGTAVTSTNDMLLMDYYTNIFKEENFSWFDFMRSCPHPKLTDEQQI